MTKVPLPSIFRHHHHGQGMPNWRYTEKRLEDARKMLRNVRDLLEWCRLHHSNQLVKKRFNPLLCDDPGKHGKMYGIRVKMKKLVNGPHSALYMESTDLLDKAHPGQWRDGERSKWIHGLYLV
jgi:hypothetical protein